MRTIPIFTRLFTILPLIAAACITLPGCHYYESTHNPAFPVTKADALADQERMMADPVPLERPVVIIGGYRSPDFNVDNLRKSLAAMTCGDEAMFTRKYTMLRGDIEKISVELVEQVEHEFPDAGNDGETVEVDVVGLSMGGLVARYAADRLADTYPGDLKLRVKRLFTISTPHRGAVMAEQVPLIEDRGVSDMVRGSLFLTKLEEAYDGDYEIFPYTRLQDGVVGAVNTAPPGRTAMWVSAPVHGGSHWSVNEDVRILTDIARRLRGEEPVAREGEPLPPEEYQR